VSKALWKAEKSFTAEDAEKLNYYNKIDVFVKRKNVSPRTKRGVFQPAGKPRFLASHEMTGRAFLDFLRDIKISKLVKSQTRNICELYKVL